MHNSQMGWHQDEASSITPLLISTSLVVLAVSSFLVGICLLEKQLRNLCQVFIYIFQGTGSSVTLWLVYTLKCYQFLGPATVLTFYIFINPNH